MYTQLDQATAFEVSWEVCNKVGGIYTVVSSKALHAVEFFDDKYYMLGPDMGDNPEFEETDEPCWEQIRSTLAMNNFQCRLGRWNIPGRPKTILVSFKDRFNVNQLLFELWNNYGVDSMNGGWDYAEPVMFSAVCGEIIAAIYHSTVSPQGHKGVALFHEWMCGAGLLTLKRQAPTMGTLFTTHATMLGRALASTGRDIYKQMNKINPVQEAANFNITAKYSMEKIAAREADCFTTVSEITALEASAFLARTPDVLTVNGLDLRVIPNYAEKRQEVQAARAQITQAIEKLLRRPLPKNVRYILISGRYEFRNKGLDLFLEALAGLNESLQGSDTHVVALFAVMGGHTGVNPDAVSGDAHKKPPRNEHWITSHHVYDSINDPILNSSMSLGLTNAPENNIQVVFVPAQLNGHDGFLNLPYEQVLAACDLGAFPSWYEPWGYTPQESAAWAVPTMTTDLAGFGLWTSQIQKKEDLHDGVYVVPRQNRSYDQVLQELRITTLKAMTQTEEELQTSRKAARRLSEFSTWEEFFPNYLEAYEHALENAAERNNKAFGFSEDIKHVLKATSSVTPILRSFMAISHLPERLKPLRELTANMWWCWQAECWELFSSIDADMWEDCEHNPIVLLANVSGARLSELEENSEFLHKMDNIVEKFHTYMKEEPQHVEDILSMDNPVAYFSTEYGICESLPIYSGGLGVLSGDHLKSASDLNIPLVAVGLLYKNGYFRQKLTSDGGQLAIYNENDFASMAVERVFKNNGEALEISLDLPGRTLHAAVWVVHVGRIKLYLLDTDLTSNTPDDRKTTAQLYVADRDCRLRQEMLLGMGGVRLLQQLDITPAVFHMNEGHSAFLILERIKEFMHKGLSFEVACEAVRASCIFTTHTPVDAGNERFSPDLMERYFTDYAHSVGLSIQDFLNMGRIVGSNRNMFEMTVLALNYSLKANGVSRLHGDVSRGMWQAAWKGYSHTEVPIKSVTNGVHVGSYVSAPMRALLNTTVDPQWLDLPPQHENWDKVYSIDGQTLWDIRRTEKSKLLRAVDKGLGSFFKTLDVAPETQRKMRAALTNPDALIIGFARRFAPYKRAHLLFADAERLQRLLGDTNRPVIFIFAGKAHPADQHGIDILRQIVKYTVDERFVGHVYFMEDYSLSVSRLLTRGCDIWLNTPCRPNEASGTSGMKPSVNGGLNLSISDGWWCEGYSKPNGWTIGPVISHLRDIDTQADYADADSLYTTLEEEVLPLYFERNANNLPEQWLHMSRHAMRTLTAQFSSHRMVNDYMRDYYVPTAARKNNIFDEDFAMAKRLAAWKQSVVGAFPCVSIDEVTFEGVDNDTLYVGQKIRILVTVNPCEMNPHSLRVEYVVGRSEQHDFVEKPQIHPLKFKEHLEDGHILFTGEFTITENGHHSYGVRIVPFDIDLFSPLDTRLVLWA